MGDEPQAPAVQPDEAPDLTEVEQPDGVIVFRVKDESGTIRYQVQTLGNVEQDMVPTILEKGVKVAREQIGLD